MDANVQNAIGNVLAACVPLFLALAGYLATYATKWLKAHAASLEAKVGQENWNLAVDWFRMLVKTAEQKGIIGDIENTGSAKKAWVLAAGQEWLDAHGIPVSVNDLDALIESAVRDGVHKEWNSAPLSFTSTSVVPVATNVTTTASS